MPGLPSANDLILNARRADMHEMPCVREAGALDPRAEPVTNVDLDLTQSVPAALEVVNAPMDGDCRESTGRSAVASTRTVQARGESASTALVRGGSTAGDGCEGSMVASPVFLGTMLEEEDKKLLKSLSKRFGGRVIMKTWSPEVTHIISATKCSANILATGERLCCRTLKYCSAVLSGQWIVGASWLHESNKQGYWVAEEHHEMHGDNSTIVDGHGAGGPRRGRMRRERGEKPLFDGLEFVFRGVFLKPTKREIIQLVKYGNGRVEEQFTEGSHGDNTSDCASSSSTKIVVYPDMSDDPNFASRAQCGLAVVDVDWILGSISRHELLPFPTIAASLSSDTTRSQQSDVF